jgi:CxxC motif-containing protein
METKVMNCIMCPMGCEMTVTMDHGKFVSVKGNTCPRGAKYAEQEVTDPKRDADDDRPDPRRPAAPAARRVGGRHAQGKVAAAVEFLRHVEVDAPVKAGQVIVADILGTGVNIVASRDMDKVVQ